ncbi:MAG: T9SS type A sorting domain-containing protein [Prevotellaceae bacterium]|jgi:hypothetical protein|nr:T9SS type A sorting domain-containing protein [Prevotellaceae bacterium]
MAINLKLFKSAFLLIIAGIFTVNLTAQSLNYNYDASGNRTKRYVPVATKSRSTDTALYKPAADSSAIKNIDDSYGDVPALETGEKSDELDVKVYPNPTSETLEVEIINLKTNGKAQLEIYTFAGQLIKRIDRVQSRQIIDLSDCASGIYLLQIIADGKTVSVKIIKK